MNIDTNTTVAVATESLRMRKRQTTTTRRRTSHDILLLIVLLVVLGRNDVVVSVHGFVDPTIWKQTSFSLLQQQRYEPTQDLLVKQPPTTETFLIGRVPPIQMTKKGRKQNKKSSNQNETMTSAAAASTMATAKSTKTDIDTNNSSKQKNIAKEEDTVSSSTTTPPPSPTYTFLESSNGSSSSMRSQSEQTLRNEIASKNYQSLPNEEQYSVVDGSIGDLLLQDEEEQEDVRSEETIVEKDEKDDNMLKDETVTLVDETKKENEEVETKETKEPEVVVEMDQTETVVPNEVEQSKKKEEEETVPSISSKQPEEVKPMPTKETPPVMASTASTKSSFDEKHLSKVLKERPYLLFMLEKGAMIVDDLVKELKSFQQEDSYIGGGFGEPTPAVTTKEKIVILGTGWGAAAFLKEINLEKYDVTVVSPRNYFLFTPMLAGASVGTVEYRSITQPIRQLKPYGPGKPRFKFIEATATNIDSLGRKVECEAVVCEGNSCTIDHFIVEYDKLIMAVGAQTNTFGIPGVREHCNFLKQVEDAQRIRTAVVNCFERASLPNLTEEDKKRILTFAVIGAGPTGVEFASELRDFVEQDLPNYYPKLLPYVSIKIIEASSQILAPFDDTLKQAAMKQIEKRIRLKTEDPELYNLGELKFTELLLESGVQEVKKDVILLNNNKTVPYGVAVWAAGIGPLPITLDLIDSLKQNEKFQEQANAQNVARGRVAIDPWLRVLGSDGSIFALGDCACNPDQVLPATAQVASQQGEHLGRVLMSGMYDLNVKDPETGKLLPPMKVQTEEGEEESSLTSKVTSFAMQSSEIAAPFQFWNLGILAYTGSGSALAQLQVTPGTGVGRVKGTGKVGFGLWRSVYLSKQVSFRNRVLVALDWAKTKVFGRDITRTS